MSSVFAAIVALAIAVAGHIYIKIDHLETESASGPGVPALSFKTEHCEAALAAAEPTAAQREIIIEACSFDRRRVLRSPSDLSPIRMGGILRRNPELAAYVGAWRVGFGPDDAASCTVFLSLQSIGGQDLALATSHGCSAPFDRLATWDVFGAGSLLLAEGNGTVIMTLEPPPEPSRVSGFYLDRDNLGRRPVDMVR